MSFLIPLGIATAGKIGSNLIKKRVDNKQIDYTNNVTKYKQDQQGRDYTSMQNTQNNGIDYLHAVAAAHGYNIPQVAFDAAHRLNGGVSGPMSVGDRFATAPMAPKVGLTESILSPIAEGVTQYGNLKLGQAGKQADANMSNSNSVTQAIIQAVIAGKIDPGILQQLGIGGFDRILQQLKGRSGATPSLEGNT